MCARRMVLISNSTIYSPVKTIGEQSYELRGFQVRFVSLQDIESKCVSSAEFESRAQQYLSQVANYHSSERVYGDFHLRDKADLPNYQRVLQGRDVSPWFSYYRWEYCRFLPIVEFEQFEHPIACILVVSSENDKPTDTLINLFDDRNPPSVFKSGIMDTTMSKYYLVLHDNQTEHNTEKKLAQLRSTFEKSKVHILRINSLKEPNEQGNYLSGEDLQNVEVFVKEFMFRGLIPQMEKSITVLHEFVESSRKGISGTLKGWLGLGSKKSKPEKLPSFPEVTEVNPNITYPLSSVENCQKRLGDLLFMLQDYSEALNVYKNALKHYTSDKSWKYYAAASEMLALCIFLLDPSRRELDTHLDNAYAYYSKDNLNRFAIRSTLFYSEILKLRRNIVESCNKLTRAAERENDRLSGAMLHEQAAFCYLFMNPPQLHRYALRLVLSGQCFSLVNQIKHTLRCYSAALPIYEGRNWTLINEHIHSMLARQTFLLAKLDDAVYHSTQLLQHSTSQAHKQSSYLREFLHIFKKRSEEKGEKMPSLPLPVINGETVSVFLRDYPPKSPLQELWKEMEISLKSKGKKKFGNKIRVNKPRVSVVGESLFVEVDVKNPLQVPLQFTQVQLVATHTPKHANTTSTTNSDNGNSNTENEKSGSSAPSAESAASAAADKTNTDAANKSTTSEEQKDTSVGDSEPPFRVIPFDLLLSPGEVKKLRLSILPLKEGTLQIKGIGFNLCGLVWGCREFILPQKRLNNTPQQRKSVVYEPNLDLTILITRAMPLLDVEFQRFPSNMYQGQLEKIQVEFKNSGKSALNNIRLKMSHPAFFSFGDNSDNNNDVISSTSEDASVVKIPIESLAANQAVSIPMWIRGHKVGNYSFNFLFYYQPEIPNEEMKYRLQRTTKQLNVSPSVKVTSSTSLSYSSINAYLLTLEVANIQPASGQSSVFHLKQISAVSSGWSLQSLSTNGPSHSSEQDIFSIAPEQSTTLFFRLTPTDASQKRNDVTQLYHTDHLLSTKCATQTQIDSSANPFYDFLLREKGVLANKKHDGATGNSENSAAEGALDLILMWETCHESDPQKHVFVGQQNIPNVNLLSPTLDKAVTVNTPLRFTIESPRKIMHDFSTESFCLVPVLFHVSNCSPSNAISFQLETLKPHEQLDSSASMATGAQVQSGKRSQYFWADTTQHFVSKLPPDGKIALDTTVCFSRPGIYNVNRYKFSLKDDKGKTYQQIYAPFQHIIIVEAKNEIIQSPKI